MSNKKILIVAGEPSGDLHASNLIKDLKTSDPALRFFGLGGSLSKAAGADILFDMASLALVGFVEVLKNIGTVGRVYRELMSRIDSERPDLAILVDYPGFNLRLAKELKKRAIPVVYYISPQLWAWGRGRISIIKRCVNKMIVFFGFEEELYKRNGVDAVFIGHPLLDIVKITAPKEETLKKYGLSKNDITIVLLPGSRIMEVSSLLPVMISAAKIINKELKNVQFIVSRHPALPLDLYEVHIKAGGAAFKLIEDDTYNAVGASDFAIVASGTATLETAIIGTPLVIVYKINPITAILYKLTVRTAFVGLVNIVVGKEVAPELLQSEATPENIASAALRFLKDRDALSGVRKELKGVKALLGESGASLRAAKAIMPLLK